MRGKSQSLRGVRFTAYISLTADSSRAVASR